MLPANKVATLVERIAGWSIRHRAPAIGGWFGLVVLALLLGALLPGQKVISADPGESGRAKVVMNAQQANEPIRESVLIQAARPEVRESAAADLVTALTRMPDAVVDVARVVSQDGNSDLVTFAVAGPDEQVKAHYNTAVDAVGKVAAAHPDTRVAQAGDRSLSTVVDESLTDDVARSGLVSLPVTLIILLVVFGALVAAGIPLLLAATAVAATFGLLGVVEHWIPVNSATSAMILLIGMAVGVDYTLFFLRREREERAAGRGVAEALLITARTSGHVVVVSGVTVMLCVSGLLFTGLDNFRGLTIGTALVVGLAMAGAVTMLPALLASLGRWVERGRVPWLGKRRTMAAESRIWTSVARIVVRRPVIWGGAATLVLLVLAVPALSMRPQDPSVTDSLPRSVPTIDAAVRMHEAFPGSPTPARVVIWDKNGGSADTPAVREAIDGLRREVAASGGLLAGPLAVVKVDRALVVRVPLAGSGTDSTSNHAVDALRDKALPAAFDGVDGIDYAVAGRTAVAKDFADQLGGRMFWVIGFVLLLAFVLLGFAFRSVAIPLVSIVLNLLSIGAAYGVLTWIFQDGHLTSVLAFTSYGAVVGWLPMFLFVLLFGLSMDYHIFILSRIRERRAGGAGARDAVVGGIGSSAGVVTSAAVIMTAVFSIFVTLSAIEYKMLGVGMAVAILIDATLVRGVLLPATLSLLGDRAWRT